MRICANRATASAAGAAPRVGAGAADQLDHGGNGPQPVGQFVVAGIRYGLRASRILRSARAGRWAIAGPAAAILERMATG